MITNPASAIKREVLQLIDLQIETLRRDSSLNSSELLDYKALTLRSTMPKSRIGLSQCRPSSTEVAQ
jgi:hypothetical protein